MANYNAADYDHPREQHKLTDRNMIIMTALKAYQWGVFCGNGRISNLDHKHQITIDPRGLAYLAMVEANIVSSDRIPNDIKIQLAKLLEVLFSRLFQEVKTPGVYGNLSLGRIVLDYTNQLHKLDLALFRILQRDDKTTDYVFHLQFSAGGNIEVNGRIILTSNGHTYLVQL